MKTIDKKEVEDVLEKLRIKGERFIEDNLRKLKKIEEKDKFIV
jgi:hypothetical protein